MRKGRFYQRLWPQGDASPPGLLRLYINVDYRTSTVLSTLASAGSSGEPQNTFPKSWFLILITSGLTNRLLPLTSQKALLRLLASIIN